MNEYDRHAAAWLRELVKEQHIPEATIDERSITEVEAKDLDGFRQCHFFAGIGGWPVALRLAGWPDAIRCWSGSCPCQPFSAAGKRKGQDDERDLWPDFFRLIRECRPGVVFGEQVASSDVVGSVGGKPSPDGRDVWLDRVFADLEAAGYTCGAAVLGAHSVGAPHIRQRLYWVAHSEESGTRQDKRGLRGVFGRSGEVVRMADAGSPSSRDISGPVDKDEAERQQEAAELAGRSSLGGMADTSCTTSGRDTGRFPATEAGVNCTRELDGSDVERSGNGGTVGAWDRYDLLPCRDGKARRVESGLFPLAHGVPGRVGLLRGYGNAIVPQVAASFIKAFMKSVGISPNEQGKH